VITQLVEGSQTLSFSQESYGNRRNYLEASANYAQKFGKHNVTAMVLFQESSLNYVGSSATTSNAALPYRNQGLAGRLTYDFDSRYFFEFNIGYNGSENFSPGHRFGVFPAFAGGWLVSEEKFWGGMKNVVDMLKLKTSWGKVGNDNIGGSRRFIYLETVSTGGSYSFGTNAGSQSSVIIGDPGNENVGWEEAKKLDLGVDMSLFNKLKIQFDYFSEHRSGIFLQRSAIPVFVGISTSPWVNIGKMNNKGFDGSADYSQKVGKVNLTAKGTFTFARNRIVDKDEPDWAEIYMNYTGQASGQLMGYVSDGLFKDWEDINSHADQSLYSPQPGDIKYVDLNNDGVIDSKDVKSIGWGSTPEIVYGFGLQAQWKSFDFSVFFQGTAHTSFFYNSSLVTPFTSSNMNHANVLSDVYGNYWTEDNLDAKYPRVTAGSNTNNSQDSDFWLADGRFLRLKNAEIGYSLPKRILNRVGISGARFYLQGQNLFTFSPFKLWDPELASSTTNYPTTRIVSLGLSFGF
jgi:TonB-linked SusC/RagA family outer membrane protein